ncbi:MAG: glycoside hydrolase [Planctomycetales bacterium]|nr:glycoside hydrolase [Planctomycetales bacterium]
MRALIAWLAAVVLLASAPPRTSGQEAEGPRAPPGLAAAKIREAPSPAAERSGMPSLSAGADGKVYLSWIEGRGGKSLAVRFAARTADGWTEARTVVEGTNLLANWADVPAVAAHADGTLAASWLERTGEEGYGARLAVSEDGGKSWPTPAWLHSDRKGPEYGFVSLMPLPDGRFAAVWLDGREMAGGHDGGHGGHGGGDMQARAVVFGKDGKTGEESLLDERVCECCPTSVAPLPGGGLAAVWRDRDEGEVRDIAVSRLAAGKWSGPALVRRDGWKIGG